MRLLKELLRAAFIGFATLLMIGTFLTAETKGPDGIEKARELLAREADERTHMLLLIGFLGAIIGLATSLLLRFFPVGPKSKVAFGVILAPVVPIVLFAHKVFADGKPADLVGITVVAAIGGFFVGLLEAARIAAPAANDRL